MNRPILFLSALLLCGCSGIHDANSVTGTWIFSKVILENCLIKQGTGATVTIYCHPALNNALDNEAIFPKIPHE